MFRSSILFLFIGLLTLVCFGTQAVPSQQLVLVIVDSPLSFQGILRQYEYRLGQWHLQGKQRQVVVGKNGLITREAKREGDNCTPMGQFPLGPIFGFDQTFNPKMEYHRIKETTVCVDDPKSQFYNQIAESNMRSKDWDSHEAMRDIPLYQYGAVIQYNQPKPIKGAGSCIFMHIWSSPHEGTGGCVAMSREDLLELLTWLDNELRPTLGVYTKAQYKRIQHEQHLPPI